jgi:hypothetical protein
MAVRRLLVSPEFLFRIETDPAGTAGAPYTISDIELASRLSFFLWSSVPDDELITVASEGRLSNPRVLEQQVKRMIADPRSDSLINNFGQQFLYLRNLPATSPDGVYYPDWDHELRQAYKREAELFFQSIIREDRSVVDLMTADYTFVNERLARQYGIPNIYGSQFRRVTLPPELDMRRGLLGKGALLTVTSAAARTAPVTRGKWYLTTFLGVEPPQPPPDVPAFKERVSDTAGNTKPPTMRQQLEAHRISPTCAACHQIFEPMGLALENFDAVGAWRTLDEGTPIDASGILPDGTKVDGVVSLRSSLLRYSDQFVRVVTEKLLTYALGRGIEYQDMPMVRTIAREAAPSKYRFSSLVMGIVKSDMFQMNQKAAAPEGARVARNE